MRKHWSTKSGLGSSKNGALVGNHGRPHFFHRGRGRGLCYFRRKSESILESETQPKPVPALEPSKAAQTPFLLRVVGALKVQQKLRLCGLLCIAAGLLPTLILLLRLKPNDPTSIEKGVITSLTCWTVLVQVLGLMMAALIGRQILKDISISLRRLGDLVGAITAPLAFQSQSDEIGALATALQQMMETARHDRQRLIQGNVALVLSNERLAQTNMELEAASAKVRQLAEQADTANLAKRNFLAVMSHEIRTPINGIIGMTELALKTPLNALQRDYVETVNSSAQSLLDLLNDILDFSKIEAGKLELEVIDFGLRDVLEDALATYAGRCHSKGIELILDVRPDVPDALIGDPYRLRQVVLNLVSNALRFTTHGEVVVRAEISQINEIETLLRFTISDTGCGIDGDKREAIFNAFTQADNSTTRRFGGTGLGLAICKQLVQLMGGWISVKSDPGRGSEFQFRARFGVGPALSAGKNTTLAGKRVLVVDAHEKSAKLLAESLLAWGMVVETAESAATAMLHLETELLNPEPFDFVIADTFHSASGGFEIAQRLPSLSPRPPKVVLLLSAARREDVPAALPVFAQLIKPARARKLRLALENTLNPQPVSAPTPASPPPSEVPHGRRLRVLVAEDNATNQRIVRTHLEAWGHIVVGAGDGSEAIERLAREPFDLIFMDLQMPKMDGVTATLAIRKKETGDSRIPIVALTANVLKGVREECLAAGMDGYLGKPVREHELLSTIESVIPGLRPVAHTQVTPSAPVPASSSDSEFPFDAAELLASVNGNRDTIAGLLRDSRDEDLPGLVATLTDALAAGNCDQIRRAAHAIKGVVGVFHAPAAYAAAKALEDTAREGKIELLADQVTELLRAVFELLTNLERFLAAPPARAA